MTLATWRIYNVVFQLIRLRSSELVRSVEVVSILLVVVVIVVVAVVVVVIVVLVET